jgi:hypothetical protein
METRTRTKAPAKGAAAYADVPPAAEMINAIENPEKTNKDIAEILKDTNIPVIGFPADDLVNLPGGIMINGELVRTAEVRELNGEDEEALARASQSKNPFHFIDRLLRCGVIRIGNSDSTDELLKRMLVGDREALILGIRNATYGNIIDVNGWRCLSCGIQSDMSVTLEDIPVSKLEDPAHEIELTVPLRKGRTAKIHLATGADQSAMYEKDELTQAQMESILLSRCIISVTEPDGITKSVTAFPSLVMSMSIPDRHAILDVMKKNQPGPRMNKIDYTCDACGEEVFFSVGIGDLFLYLRRDEWN